MIPGTWYSLDEAILSVYRGGDSHIFFRIPAGEEVYVVGEQPETPFTQVRWHSELLRVFALDLHERAQQLNRCDFSNLTDSYLAISA